MDRIFEFNSPVEMMSFGSRFQWKIFIASVRNRIRLCYETNEFPRQNSGSARHCGLSMSLSKSVLLGAHWRAVCF